MKNVRIRTQNINGGGLEDKMGEVERKRERGKEKRKMKGKEKGEKRKGKGYMIYRMVKIFFMQFKVVFCLIFW